MSIMTADIPLLTPAIASGWAFMDFISKPPRLHITAVAARNMIAFGLSFKAAFSLK
jgi:hypothetical protein